jgi:DivIVA domain-containing protein
VTFSFPSASSRDVGYSQDQVDEFISRARRQFEDPSQNVVSSELLRRAEFGLVRGGYDITSVDYALDRLEDAFAQKELARELAEMGSFALEDRLAKFVETLQLRIDRPRRKRFSKISWPLRGYSVKQVDEFCENLERYLFSGSAMTAGDVRKLLFRTKRGGYEEQKVDAFIERAIEVIHLRQALQK